MGTLDDTEHYTQAMRGRVEFSPTLGTHVTLDKLSPSALSVSPEIFWEAIVRGSLLDPVISRSPGILRRWWAPFYLELCFQVFHSGGYRLHPPSECMQTPGRVA